MPILQFRVSLPECTFPLWRRFRVTDDYRFDRFHQVIQLAMGWDNYHLHEFTIGNRRIGMVLGLDDGYPELEDETKLYLRDFHLQPGDRMDYLYDFGGSWEHLIELESIIEGQLEVPYCLDGNGRCPIEDSGGVGGYLYALEALKDPNHPDRFFWGDEPPESYEDYNPEFFPIEEMNAELALFGAWHKKHPKARSTPWHIIE